jgi:hypothetical protein
MRVTHDNLMISDTPITIFNSVKGNVLFNGINLEQTGLWVHDHYCAYPDHCRNQESGINLYFWNLSLGRLRQL